MTALYSKSERTAPLGLVGVAHTKALWVEMIILCKDLFIYSFIQSVIQSFT